MRTKALVETMTQLTIENKGLKIRLKHVTDYRKARQTPLYEPIYWFDFETMRNNLK